MAARSSVMVGRDAELAVLREAFARAEAGAAQVAVVTGEAGIGKTRLVREFVAGLPEEAVVAFGHAVPLSGGALPYGVAGDLLRSIVRELGADLVAEVLGERARVLTPLAPRLGSSAESLDRLALFATSQDLLVELATERTLTLVVEDLHWADESSIELVEFWCRTFMRARLLIVVTVRVSPDDDPARGVAGELRRLPNAVCADVGALGHEAVSRQIELLDDSVPQAMAEEIHRLSDGVPLFVEELVSDGSGESSALRLDLGAGLRSCEEETRRVIQLGALEAHPFDVETLAAVCGRRPGEVEAALAGATSYVVEDQQGQWRFRHELLRVAAAALLSGGARRTGHRAWAQALARPSDPADLRTCADHWQEAGESESALDCRIRAARACARLAETAETNDQWMSARSMLGESSMTRDESVQEEILGGSCVVDGFWVLPDRVLALDDDPDDDSVRSSLHRLARIVESGSTPSAIDLDVLEARLEGEEAARPLLFHCWVLLAWICDDHGLRERQGRAIAKLGELSARLSEERPELQLVHAEWLMTHWFGVAGGDPEPVSAVLESLLDRSRRFDTASRAHLLSRLAWFRFAAGRLGEALTLSREAMSVAHGPEIAPRNWGTAAATTLEILWVSGDWDEALALAEPLLRLESVEFHNRAVAVGGLVHAARGEWTELSADVSRVRTPRREGGGDAPHHSTRFVGNLIEALHLARDDVVAARLALAGALGADMLSDIAYPADLMAVAGRLASTLPFDSLYAAQVEQASSRALTPGLTSERLTTSWVATEVRRARASDSRPEWTGLVEAWTSVGAPYYEAQCRLRLAETCMREGDRDETAEVLGAALTTAEELRARPLADEIRSLASRARLVLPGHEPAAQGETGRLTAREHEVLQLVVQGMTNDQIGTALFMSPRTASVHVSRILAKLGAVNRTEVAAIAHRQGLVTAGE
jgi:DNA-binding CsgD family transcriptional regulator